MFFLRKSTLALILIVLTLTPATLFAGGGFAEKPSPEQIKGLLMEGNARFVSGKSAHPNTDRDRLALAGRENQGKHALATVLACSDSRVPVERLFDAGIMDLFVVRVAGAVCNADETGSIEYGLAHVHTPLLVVLGHTQCGAVTAVTHDVLGDVHQKLERNIPPLVASIYPAVKRTISLHPEAGKEELPDLAMEENIWESIRNLFMASPAVRELTASGKVWVMGAVYDVSTVR